MTPACCDLAAAERQHLPGELGGAIGGAVDLLGVGAARIVGAHPVDDDVGVAEDRGEQVVEVVSDAAGQPSHGFHLLRVTEQLLELHALAQCIVALGDHGREDLATHGDDEQEEERRGLSGRGRQASDGADAQHAGEDRHGREPAGDQAGAAGAEPHPGPRDDGEDERCHRHGDHRVGPAPENGQRHDDGCRHEEKRLDGPAPPSGIGRECSSASASGAVVAIPSQARMNHIVQNPAASPGPTIPDSEATSVPSVAEQTAPAGAAASTSVRGLRTRSSRSSKSRRSRNCTATQAWATGARTPSAPSRRAPAGA